MIHQGQVWGNIFSDIIRKERMNDIGKDTHLKSGIQVNL